MTDVFDVSDYTRDAYGPIETNRVEGITPDVAQVLSYVERWLGDTATWMAKVLVTATHKEARITAFLATWAYEQLWLSASLGALIGEGEEKIMEEPSVRRIASTRGPFFESLVSNIYGHSLIGVQMSERLIDGWLLDKVLERLLDLTPDAAHETLNHARQVLGRQQTFFFEAAMKELENFDATRKLTRKRVKSRAFPIGSEYESKKTNKQVFQTLFASDPVWEKTLDEAVDALPGLRGLRVFDRLKRRNP